MKTARKVNDQIIDLYIYEYQEKHNVCLVKVGAKRWRTVLTEIELTLKEIIENIDGDNTLQKKASKFKDLKEFWDGKGRKKVTKKK